MTLRTTTAIATALGVLALPATAQNFDDPTEFAEQEAQLAATPMGPQGAPWEQYLEDSMVDTTAMAATD